MKAVTTQDEMPEVEDSTEVKEAVGKSCKKNACGKTKRIRMSRGSSALDPEQRTILRKTRRSRANDRERSRMHELNRALEALRSVLPNDGAPYTKIETLRCARNYIEILAKYLQAEEHATVAFAFNRQLHAQLEAAAAAAEAQQQQVCVAPVNSPNSCRSSPVEDVDSSLPEHAMQHEYPLTDTSPSPHRLTFGEMGGFPTPDSSPHSSQEMAASPDEHVTTASIVGFQHPQGVSGRQAVVAATLRLSPPGHGARSVQSTEYFFDSACASSLDSAPSALPVSDYKIFQRMPCLSEPLDDIYHNGYQSLSPARSAQSPLYDRDSFL